LSEFFVPDLFLAKGWSAAWKTGGPVVKEPQQHFVRPSSLRRAVSVLTRITDKDNMWASISVTSHLLSRKPNKW